MKNIKTRMIAAVISTISVFSVATMASQSAFAAETAPVADTQTTTPEERWEKEWKNSGYFASYEEFCEFCAWLQENPGVGGVYTWKWMTKPEVKEWAKLFPGVDMFSYEMYMDIKENYMTGVSDEANHLEYMKGKELFPQCEFIDFVNYLGMKYVCGNQIDSFVDFLNQQYAA